MFRYGNLQLWSFPRFHRRGLIEATPFPRAPHSGESCVFRGFTAAASLKLALLEEMAKLPVDAVFRGFTAAASLKPVYDGDTFKVRCPFSAVSPPRPH